MFLLVEVKLYIFFNWQRVSLKCEKCTGRPGFNVERVWFSSKLDQRKFNICIVIVNSVWCRFGTSFFVESIFQHRVSGDSKIKLVRRRTTTSKRSMPGRHILENYTGNTRVFGVEVVYFLPKYTVYFPCNSRVPTEITRIIHEKLIHRNGEMMKKSR